MGNVDYLSASMLSCLVVLQKSLWEYEIKLCLVNLCPKEHHLLTLAGLTEGLAIFEDQTSAIAFLTEST